MRIRAALIALAACLCLGAAAAPDASVTIDNFHFGPGEIAVPVGTTVVWTNRDDIPHTVTGVAGQTLFRSPPLDTDERFSHTFDRAGRFTYFCSLHAHMQGVVVVR